jgi:hypothetical protein
MRKATILGLVVAAALAVTAVAAPASQAANAQFRCVRTAPCIVQGESAVATLQLGGGSSIGCSLAVAGEMPEEYSPSLSVSASIYGCKVQGIKLPVEMNGCGFTFHPDAEGFGSHAISTDITCPAGKEIVVHTGAINCTWKIGAQAGLGGLTMSESQEVQEGGGFWWVVNSTNGVKNISYTNTGTECFNAPGSHSDGGLNPNVVLKAYESLAGIPGKRRSLQLS